MRHYSPIFGRLSGATIVAAALFVALPVSAEEPGEVKITLAAKDMPQISRPHLNKLKGQAKKTGRPLSDEIDAEASKLVPPGDATIPDLMIDDLDLMEIADLKLVAKQYGLSLEEAIDRYGWEGQFSEAHQRIVEKFGDQVAGAAIVDTESDNRGAWFAFSGGIPEGAVDLVDDLPVEVQIVGNKGYTRTELQQEAERALSEIPAGVSAMVTTDVITGKVHIRAHKAISTMTSTSLQPEPSKNPKIKFDVELVADPPVRQVDNWQRGGGLLNFSNGNPQCTMGFNIYKDSLRSPSTAGHCARTEDGMVYANHSSDGGTTTVQKKLRYEGIEGDFARYGPGGMSSTDTYYYDWNLKRYVDQVASYEMTNEQGKTLCKFGRTSGATCGTVNSVGVGFTNDISIVIGRQVYMNGGACTKGDSGGPFYWGGNAYGLTTATSGGNCWFSQARFIPNGLSGWKVVTR